LPQNAHKYRGLWEKGNVKVNSKPIEWEGII
jgi:hypothetical protein